MPGPPRGWAKPCACWDVAEGWGETRPCPTPTARRAGSRRGGASPVPDSGDPPVGIAAEGGRRLDAWIEAAAERLGIEAVPVTIPYPEVASFCNRSGPALVRLSNATEPRFLVGL